MAHHSSDAVSWFLAVPTAQKEHLGAIRHWPTLKIAFADDRVWVSGFDAAQVASATVQTIPYKTVYYSHGDKLFRPGSLLPEQSVPALLWSPIERGLPVTLPAFRGNYVADQPLTSVKITPSAGEQPTVALRVRLTDLAPYVETAPAIRLRALRWVLLGADEALLLGAPFLPVPGDALWQRGNSLLPAGYDFDLFVLANLLNNTLNPDGRNWLVWQLDSGYFPVPKRALQPLSPSSLRATLMRATLNGYRL